MEKVRNLILEVNYLVGVLSLVSIIVFFLYGVGVLPRVALLIFVVGITPLGAAILYRVWKTVLDIFR
ncbi:MAG TPA: hypothetical protein VIH52_03970 [Candidatus Nanoarchaeia archaeon]|nr:hypothetical protein [uncultured archaeon]